MKKEMRNNSYEERVEIRQKEKGKTGRSLNVVDENIGTLSLN